MKYRRMQEAEVMSLSCPHDTTVITSGDAVEIFTSVPSRKTYMLARQLKLIGKLVEVFERKYLPEKGHGWQEIRG